MKTLPTIRETVVGQVEKENLYYEMLYKFLGIDSNDDIPDYEWVRDYVEHQTYWKENDHLPIELLQEAVDELKAMGATHVQIYPHGDHESYYFTGVKLEMMDEKVVKERQRKELERSVMHNTIKLQHDEKELEEQRKRLEEQKAKLEELDETK